MKTYFVFICLIIIENISFSQTDTTNYNKNNTVNSDIQLDSDSIIYSKNQDFVYVIFEKMPKFKGGDVRKFKKWVMKNVTYPSVAIKNRIEGTVVASFIVNEKGRLENIKIVRSVDPSLDYEVINILRNSPKWKPGKQDGKKVQVKFTIPIVFQL